MADHTALFVALGINILLGATRIYARWARDWCGWALARFVGIQLCVPNLILILLYLHFAHIVPWERVANYRVLVAFAIAQGAERLMQYVTSKSDTQSLINKLTVGQRIARKKVDVVTRIIAAPNSHDILCNIVNAGVTSLRSRRSLIASLSTPPSRDDGFRVLDKVGLNLMKRFVP